MRAALFWIYFMTCACLIGLVFCFAAGGMRPTIALASLLAGFVAAGVLTAQDHHVPEGKKPVGFWAWASVVFFTLFSLRSFMWYAYYGNDELRMTNGHNLGDIAIHITFIEYLASGVPFWPANPIAAHAPLSYPAGVDFFNSLLRGIGLDLCIGFVWVGLLSSYATARTLWRWGGAFALAAFLGNGGFELFRELLKTPLAEWRIMEFSGQDAWNPISTCIFVTQRGMLYAVPAGLFLLGSWRRRFFEPEANTVLLPTSAEILLYSAMPFFHLHTFLFLSAVLGWWFVTQAAARAMLLRIVGTAFVPATALVLCSTGGFAGKGNIHLAIGWEMKPEDHPLVFWVMNFGAWIPAAGLLGWQLMKSKDWRWPGALIVPAALIFFTCCFVSFAVWPWDNTKLMTWSYLCAVPFIWRYVIEPRAEATRIVWCALLLGTGLLSTLGGMADARRGHTVFALSEVRTLARDIRHLPLTETIIGRPIYNHPAMMAGRKMMQGFRGHIYSHGLGTEEMDRAVDQILLGQPGWLETARELNVRYLFWGTREEEDVADNPYRGSAQPWRGHFNIAAEGQWGRIYDLERPLFSAPAGEK